MKTYLYSEPAAVTLDLKEVAKYTRKLLPSLEVEIREAFLQHHLDKMPLEARQEAIARLAQQFAEARVRDPRRLSERLPPLLGEINYEMRRLTNPESKAFGILYDGLKLGVILGRLILKEESSLAHIHIVFTNQLLGTWDDGDRRYHARVILCGFPSIISTSGVVEAPAKPREYYFLKQQYLGLGMGDAAAIELDAEFRGRYIDYDDQRLTEVVKGYVLQAIVYHLSGDPFCEDRNCRLYNAHWQEELIRAQLDGDYEFCPGHEKVLRQLDRAMAPIKSG